jgi:hypothetical protein
MSERGGLRSCPTCNRAGASQELNAGCLGRGRRGWERKRLRASAKLYREVLAPTLPLSFCVEAWQATLRIRDRQRGDERHEKPAAVTRWGAVWPAQVRRSCRQRHSSDVSRVARQLGPQRRHLQARGALRRPALVLRE